MGAYACYSLWLVTAVIRAAIEVGAACVPSAGCRALAFYNISLNEQLNQIYSNFNVNFSQLQEYNDIANENSVLEGQILNIPFQCECKDGRLSHNFRFDNVSASDTPQSINRVYYHGLSDPSLIGPGVLYPGQPANVPVNCSCGSPDFPEYGLFLTYPVQEGDTAQKIAQNFNLSVANLTNYNSLNSLAVGDHLFIPAKDLNGTYPRFSGGSDSEGSNIPVIVGATVGAAVALLAASGLGFWFCVYRPHRKARYGQSNLEIETAFVDPNTKQGLLHASNGGNNPPGFSDFAVDKSVEFSYEELSAATNNFSISNKIGEGGYGAVYYAEVRDQKLAIKKMNMQATREFMSELKVLTHVHHTNLVQLIGYCTVESLFLVYEYVDNGTLAQHLRGSGTRLSWNQRIQIALDAARGLEYIHEHTKPTYIHRDVKSPNILIDKKYRAKVADFGLTKLTESTAGGSASLTQPTRLVGTFGYMPPEYARFGDVSPKIDVYSFGVVLYEIISAKDAIVRTTDADDLSADPSQKVPAKGLVTLFDAVLKGPSPTEQLKDLVDPALGTSYPFESVWKLAKLAEACTQETPENRPNMRAVVVALMTLCSSTQELDFSAGYSDANIHGLVTGR